MRLVGIIRAQEGKDIAASFLNFQINILLSLVDIADNQSQMLIVFNNLYHFSIHHPGFEIMDIVNIYSRTNHNNHGFSCTIGHPDQLSIL